MTPGSSNETGEKKEVAKVFTGLDELIKELHDVRKNKDSAVEDAVYKNRAKIENLKCSSMDGSIGSIEFVKTRLSEGVEPIREMYNEKIEEIFEQMCRLVVERLICFKVSDRPKVIEQITQYGMTNTDLVNLQNRILKRILMCEVSLIHAYK